MKLVGVGSQREQHVPFSNEVESRRDIVGYISGGLGRSFSAVIIHYHLHLKHVSFNHGVYVFEILLLENK